MNIEEAKKVLEEAGYLLDICWTVQDIKDAVTTDYDSSLFDEEDYNDIATHLINSFDANDGVTWDTIDIAIRDLINIKSRELVERGY